MSAPRRERDGLRHGQARYLVRKLQKAGRDAWSIRANDDTYVVFSMPAMRTVKG